MAPEMSVVVAFAFNFFMVSDALPDGTSFTAITGTFSARITVFFALRNLFASTTALSNLPSACMLAEASRIRTV